MDLLFIYQDVVIMTTSLKVALYLLCLCLWKLALTTSPEGSVSVHQETSFIAADIGDTVTLQCVLKDQVSTLFFWYKQSLGQEPRLISTFYYKNQKATFIQEFEKEGRFALETEPGKLNLTITNLKTSDSATYYCVGKYVKTLKWGNGTFLSVRSAGTNIPASVYQSSSQNIQSGDPLTLNCTVHTGSCGGEYSVYWFRHSGQSHPGLIYTKGGRSDQCESKKNSTNPQTHVCIYKVKNQNISHAETDYCAVATCGHILFGIETKQKKNYEVDLSNLTLVHVLSGALVLTTILVVLLALLVFKACTESQTVSASDTTPQAGRFQDQHDGDDLHYAALKTQKVNRSRRQRGNSENDCVYASVRQ